MSPYLLGIIGATALLLFVIYMLRRGVLREKFAFLWLITASALLVMAVFPDLTEAAARAVGVQLPVNLLFSMFALLMLLVSVQFSFEISRLEGRTRRLAEEVALLRAERETPPGGEPIEGDGSPTAS